MDYKTPEMWVNYAKNVEKNLVEALEPNEITELQSHLNDLGLKAYADWINQNRRSIDAFLSACPSKSTKNNWNPDYLYTLKLYLAGIQFARASLYLYEALDDSGLFCHELELFDRFDASKNACLQMYYNGNPFSYWPFEDVCPNPFQS